MRYSKGLSKSHPIDPHSVHVIKFIGPADGGV